MQHFVFDDISPDVESIVLNVGHARSRLFARLCYGDVNVTENWALIARLEEHV